jgi:hypothetical protein
LKPDLDLDLGEILGLMSTQDQSKESDLRDSEDDENSLL